jgi:putative Ig domain-containing protein/flagellar hook capping protein FlgD/fibronectin type III domain protein/WD40 repeat protein
MLRSRWWLVTISLLSLVVPFPLEHVRGDTVQCTTGDSTAASAVVVGQFHVFRPGTKNEDLLWRDLEFMWGASYPGGLSFDARNTLDNFASTLVEDVGTNPFGAALSKVNLNYNYFSTRGATYNRTNPRDSTSMAVLRFADENTTNADKSHADVYLQSGGPAQWPAFYTEAYEDTSTGHPVNLASPDNTDVKRGNSISAGGPALGSHIDLTGNGWTHPNAARAITFGHEFEHAINPLRAQGHMMDEMFAAASEAVCGNADTSTTSEVPYTWPLTQLHHILSCDDCCNNPRDAVFSNYQGRSLFTAYLAYNFRGADTSATADGLNDDLLRKWSRNTVPDPQIPGVTARHMGKLAELLGDDSCGTCVGKNYFHPGGTPLANSDRMQLLLHNWRVANYVNRSDLPGTEGQYGFPPQFGFSPAKNLKGWQDFDNCKFDDLVAIPPVVTLTGAHVSQEMNLRVKREYRDNWHPMRLKSHGSEYWVIRADTASLGTTPRDLVITVATDSIFRHNLLLQHQDGRLMASVVAYTHRAPDADESPQWQNPAWATLALEPKWADVDSLPAELVFAVPSFGLSYKAAVVVITLGDGPSRVYENTGLTFGDVGVGARFELPYRMALALRGTPNDTLPNPRGLQQDPLVVADSPTWSPASDEVAFTRFVPATGASRIYRQLLSSAAVPLASGTELQSHPDWSPRGDWIVLSQPPAAGPSEDRHIWVYSTGAPTAPRELTSGATVLDRSPAFQPNGQAVAYARHYWYFDGSTYSERWQLRRINLDGTGDVPLVYPGSDYEPKSLRWSPDGLWIYFTRNDSLFAVSRDNGAIVPHPEIMTKVTSFDFHLSGTHRLAAEQSGNAGSLWNQYPPEVSFRRLVLRDVAATDTRARFYRTGAEFYNPRWSPNGLRVAYSSNQNLPTDRDLFLGQVSYNQPPQLISPVDVEVHPGQTFQMLAYAADPNGETLTYDMPALYLPPGASFSSSTRLFTWPNPGPQGSSHYVVVRAFDGSGGVANRVVKLTVTLNAVSNLNSDVIGDTQVWLPWTAPGQGSFQGVEYDLRYAQFALHDANFGLGWQWTLPAPSSPGTYETTTVDGLAPETQYWFAIKTKDANGNWSAISNVFSATTIPSGGGGGFRAQERGPVIAGRRLGEPGGAIPALIVEMDLVRGAPVWSLRQLDAEEAVAMGANDSVSALFQARDGGGEWFTRSRIIAAEAPWRFGVRAFRQPGRIIFFGPYGARQAWNSVEFDRPDALASLVTAKHSRLGALEGTFDASGRATFDVSSGDTLVLAYEAVAVEAPAGPDWFLIVGPPGSEVSTSAFARPQAKEAALKLPTTIALRQNQPNPFSLTTEIRFELPAPSPVRLEVFDLQGRRIATLVEGSIPAGFHTVTWDRRDATGSRVKPGIYLYRLEAASFRDQKKMSIF